MKRTPFKRKPTVPLKRTPLKAKSTLKRKSKQKETKVSILRKWGVPDKTTLRYKNPIEKGILWYWTSKYVCLRDYITYGRCISCNKPKTLEELQGGHYAPAGNCGSALLFDLSNVNGECGGCNGFDPGHLIGYEKNYIERYGEESMRTLKERYHKAHFMGETTKQPTKLEYEIMINDVKNKYQNLKQ